jgi:hypothetical protein
MIFVVSVHCEVDPDELHDEYIRAWRTIPANVSPNINTEQELDAVKRFISPVLFSGFDNSLFLIATAYAIAKEIKSTVMIAWWDQAMSNLPVKYLPFAGLPPGITLKHIFPNIHYVDFYPATRNVLNSTNCAFHLNGAQAREFHPFPKSLRKRNQSWIKGVFINHQCLCNDILCSDSYFVVRSVLVV